MRVNVTRAVLQTVYLTVPFYSSHGRLILSQPDTAPKLALTIYRPPQLSAVLPQSGFAGADDGLGAVGDLQLGEDVGDVVSDGLGAEVEVGGYLHVAQTHPPPIGSRRTRRRVSSMTTTLP
jgi:hypothetical protein